MIDIKNIIFDFGGVIINISHKKVENAFKALGVKNFDMLFNQATQSKLFKRFETGEMNDSQFRDSLRELAQMNTSNREIDEAWNQIIGEYPLKRINMLNKIKHNYRLFLLSNTNIIHFNNYIPKFESEYGYDFESIFERAYWSFKFGKRKPDFDAYTDLIEENQLIPEETLFIDDTIQNVVTAQKVGLKTYHLTNDLDITEIFTDGILNQPFFSQTE